MTILRTVDHAILDGIYQPSTDAVCDLTGQDCFWQGMWINRISVLLMLVQVATHPHFASYVLAAVLIALGVFQEYIPRPLVRPGTLNPKREVIAPRIFCLVSAGLIIPSDALSGNALNLVMWLSLVSGSYTMACTPLPSLESR